MEAILTAGHIPAGMELFAAGDESQMNTIKRWIDESDVFLLIIGGRYGSIEPNSQQSYIQLEYEYAVEKGKPLFAVVITEDYLEEKVKKLGSNVFEKEYPQKLKEFRALVLTKMVKFWSEPRDIKLAILETMAEFSRREDLVGWIPGSETVNTGVLAEEIARLTKENANMREQLAKSPTTSSTATYNSLTFQQMYELLASTKLDEGVAQNLQEPANAFGDSAPGLIHLFWVLRECLLSGNPPIGGELNKMVMDLRSFGLIRNHSGRTWLLTDSGQQFLTRLRLELRTKDVDRYVW